MPARAKKLYYKIGEACKVVDIQPYVLRYWETEFPALNPSKSKSGQRVYGEKELALIRRIKELLYDEGYTIAGAKKKLEGELSSGGADTETAEEAPAPAPPAEKVAEGDGESRIQSLEQGIRGALNEAREILTLIDG